LTNTTRFIAATEPMNTPYPGSRIGEYIETCIVREVTATLTHSEVLARFGHALSDPTRTHVLLALNKGCAYPADLADLAGVSRQALSNHLACLRGCGLVVAVPEGRRMRYELADPRLSHALTDLLGVVLAIDPAACPESDAEDCC
jgi:DNA-binding transcriptional ArsR family regulator